MIVRRPKLNRENFPGVSWDSLPEELLLGIFSCLCLPELLKVSSVFKRWYHLAFDESLWQTVDLAGRNLYPDVVGQLLSQGVVAFRCPRSFMDQPSVEYFSLFRLQHLDLSNSVIMRLPCTAFCLTAPSCRISAWKASDFQIPLLIILLRTQIYCD